MRSNFIRTLVVSLFGALALIASLSFAQAPKGKQAPSLTDAAFVNANVSLPNRACLLENQTIQAGHATKIGSTEALRFEPFAFTSSGGETIAAEMAWLTVPENRQQPERSSIRLPVVRFKSVAQKPLAPLIYLAGGPGVSGIESARQNIFPLLMALRERGDVIVFDQRGTGKAEPSLLLPGKLDLPLDVPLDTAASRQHLVERAKQYAAEMRQRGIDLSAYNTNESADDVNDLRRSLGVEQVILWGHSYGSHLGLAVLKRHGQHVQRAIFGGVNGPDQRWRYPNDLQELLERVDQRINAFPKLRREIPSLQRLAAEVFDRLDKQPVTVKSQGAQGQSIVIGKKEVQVITALLAGDLEFVISLPLFFSQMRAGDFSRVAQLTVAALKRRDADTAMRYSMHIASGVSAERAARITAQQDAALFGNAINFPFDNPEFLAAWGIADLGAAYRAPVRSDVPVLLLSGDLDGRTSQADAEAVAQSLSRSRLVVIEGASHDVYHLGPQVWETMLAFLDDRPFKSRVMLTLQLRGPSELRLLAELRKLAGEKGIAAAVKRMREIYTDPAAPHVSTYLAGTWGMGLWQQDKQPADAVEAFKAGVELAPSDPFLNERLADLQVAMGEKAQALRHYRKCVELNSLNRVAAAKLKRLEAEGGK